MAYRDHRQTAPRSVAARAADLVWSGAGTLHRGTARLVGGVGRAAGAGVRALPWSCRFGLLSAVLATSGVLVGAYGHDVLFSSVTGLGERHRAILEANGALDTFGKTCLLLAVFGVTHCIAAFAAFVRFWLSWT